MEKKYYSHFLENYNIIACFTVHFLRIYSLCFRASLLGVFITKGDVGVGTIVGSAVFNILVIIGLCGIFAGQVCESITLFPTNSLIVKCEHTLEHSDTNKNTKTLITFIRLRIIRDKSLF